MGSAAVQEQPEGHGDMRTDRLRAAAEVVAAGQAAQLLLVADLVRECERDLPEALAAAARGAGPQADSEFVASIAADETMVALGIGKARAQHLVELAGRLSRVLPQTFTALMQGQLDLPRVQALVEGTAELSDDDARAVQALVLADAGDAPWSGPSPRAWRARIERAVVRVDADAARRRHLAAVAARRVVSWPNPSDGTASLLVTAAHHDVAMVNRVVTDLASAWPATGPDGARLTMDQRRCDAVLDVFRRIRDGAGLPAGSAAAREPDVALVLHADTLFADGPARAAPGQLRRITSPTAVDSVTAAEQARLGLARGAAIQVMLVGADAGLERVVRLAGRVAGSWTRGELRAAVRAALHRAQPHRADSYPPTTAIARHVRARRPTCSYYDCARRSINCDLDHDTPWPRGPTEVTNVDPKCPRHHDRKTRRLLSSRLHPDGAVTWTTFTGLVVTTRPEPLPGYAAGEGYCPLTGGGR